MEKKFGTLDGIAITTERNSSDDNHVVNINMPPKERETRMSKVAWKFIIPNISAIVGAVVATIIIKYTCMDAGTFESLHKATNFVGMIEQQYQGMTISAPP